MEITLWTICTALAVIFFIRWKLRIEINPLLIRQEEQTACRSFFLQREYLEAKFLESAQQFNSVSNVEFLECDWNQKTNFVRDRYTGYINAFVSFNLVYEVVPSCYEGESFRTQHANEATAIFYYEAGRWQTQGKTLFNLSPENVTQQHQEQYEELQVA